MSENKKYFRIPAEKFEELLRAIEASLVKQDTMMRSAIPPRERLAVTLRYLATGEKFASLEKQFRISRTAISYIVLEVSHLVTEVLRQFWKFCSKVELFMLLSVILIIIILVGGVGVELVLFSSSVFDVELLRSNVDLGVSASKPASDTKLISWKNFHLE